MQNSITEKKIGHDESEWLVKWLRTQKEISPESFNLKHFVKFNVEGVISEVKEICEIKLTEKDVLTGLRRIME